MRCHHGGRQTGSLHAGRAALSRTWHEVREIGECWIWRYKEETSLDSLKDLTPLECLATRGLQENADYGCNQKREVCMTFFRAFQFASQGGSLIRVCTTGQYYLLT